MGLSHPLMDASEPSGSTRREGQINASETVSTEHPPLQGVGPVEPAPRKANAQALFRRSARAFDVMKLGSTLARSVACLQGIVRKILQPEALTPAGDASTCVRRFVNACAERGVR